MKVMGNQISLLLGGEVGLVRRSQLRIKSRSLPRNKLVEEEEVVEAAELAD